MTLHCVTSIGVRAFKYCGSLKSVKLSKKVKTIGKQTFYDCDSLKSITIPKNVKKIGKRAFGYIYNYSSDEYIKIKNFKIKGKKGSAAEKYAKNEGFKFIGI